MQSRARCLSLSRISSPDTWDTASEFSEASTNAAPADSGADRYLISREAAAYRYSMSVREIDRLARCPEFPTVRHGRRVLIHRRLADEYFDREVMH